MRTILAIGAHFDDVEIGCSGSLLAWKRQGHRLALFVATDSGYRDPAGNVIRAAEDARAEGMAAAQLLGAELYTGDEPTFRVRSDEPFHAKLLTILLRVKPDIVLTHWVGDPHHDHREVALATLHCARRVPRLLAYRSNWDPSATTFEPRFFVDIEETLEQKVALVRMHGGEFARTGGRWEEQVRAQARVDGVRAGVAAAEAFEAVRWLA